MFDGVLDELQRLCYIDECHEKFSAAACAGFEIFGRDGVAEYCERQVGTFSWRFRIDAEWYYYYSLHSRILDRLHAII